jgi:hypothetical protein
MAVRDSTVQELTKLCGERYADPNNTKSWNRLVADAIRGRGITFGPDVTELKHRIIQTGAAHSASKSKAGAASRKRSEATMRRIAS